MQATVPEQPTGPDGPVPRRRPPTAAAWFARSVAALAVATMPLLPAAPRAAAQVPAPGSAIYLPTGVALYRGHLPPSFPRSVPLPGHSRVLAAEATTLLGSATFEVDLAVRGQAWELARTYRAQLSSAGFTVPPPVRARRQTVLSATAPTLAVLAYLQTAAPDTAAGHEHLQRGEVGITLRVSLR